MSEPKTPDQMLSALGKAFPRNAVKQRQGGGGRMFDYVETHTVIHRLNSATNGEWSFYVKDVQWRSDLLIVLGELTIPGLGTRSGFGVQKVSDRGGEDLVKGASSDALKKAATLFGVALELYGSDYEANVAPQAAQRPRSEPQPANATKTPAPANIDRERAMKRLHAVGTQHGIDHEGLRALVVAKAAASGESISSLQEAPGWVLAETATAIEKDPAKLKGWVAKQQELLPGVEDVPNPDRFTQ